MTFQNDKILRCVFFAGIFLFFVVLFGIASARVLSWDIFWQLQSGRYIWETGRVIDRDVFSLASGAFRHEHCWLHDLIFYGIYLVGGYKGLSLFKGFLIALTAFSLLKTALARGTSFPFILVAFPPLIILSCMNWLDRPQLWTFLFVALLLFILERQISIAKRGVYLAIPLTLLWVNLHAGAIIVYPILAAYIIGLLADRYLCHRPLPSGFRHIIIATPLIALMFLLTPSAKTSWISGAATSAVQGHSSGAVVLTQNMDWAPWSIQNGIHYPLSVTLVGLILLLNWRRVSFKDLFLLGGLAFMGFRLERHTPFFLFASAAIVPLYLEFTWKNLVGKFRFFDTPYVKIALSLCALLLIFSTIRPAWLQYGFFDTGIRTWRYPVGAADFVRDVKPPGNIFHNYEWGGYLMWRLFPEYKVFWDGRQLSTEMFVLGNRIVGGETDRDEILKRFDINTIILSPVHYMTGGRQAKILDPLRRDSAWTLVYAGESEVVFVRTSAMDPIWLKGRALPDSRVDDVILGLTSKLLEKNPMRFKAYGERARIYLERKELRQALAELEKYVALAPAESADPEAVKIYHALRNRMKGRN